MKSALNVALCAAANSAPSLAIALSLSSLYELCARRRRVAPAPAAGRGRPRPAAAASPAPPTTVTNALRVIPIDIPPCPICGAEALIRRPRGIVCWRSHPLPLDGAGRSARQVVICEIRKKQDHREPWHEGGPQQAAPVE